MALNRRQLILYTHRVDIWRKVRNGSGNWIIAKIISALPCKLYSTPNVDKNATIGLVKDPGIFTYDVIHCEAAIDLRPEDSVHQYDPTDAFNTYKGKWWSTVGETRVREDSGRRTPNVAEAYINPTKRPGISGDT